MTAIYKSRKLARGPARSRQVGDTHLPVSAAMALGEGQLEPGQRPGLGGEYPIVLYAADHTSMAAAVAEAKSLALPAGDVTGTFVTAWNDLTGGSDLLLAAGKAADNALFYNPCGWANPAGTGADWTPFSYLGLPLQQPPGANNYEPSDGSTAAATAALTAQLSHYALAGTLPNQAVTPPPISLPRKTCLGSRVVPVP